MATMGGIFCPDYDGTQAPATGYVGTLAQNANTGAFFEFDGSIDSINLANLDNGATGLVYCFLPLIRN